MSPVVWAYLQVDSQIVLKKDVLLKRANIKKMSNRNQNEILWLNKKRKKNKKRQKTLFCTRVGVIIDCSQKYLFHDLVNVILTSQMAVSEMVDNNNDNDWPLAILF